MPRTKEREQQTKGAPQPIVVTLRKLLRTYEKHCAQSQTSVCAAIKRDLKTSISSEQVLRKFILLKADALLPGTPRVSLEALLLAIQDVGYMLGTDLCIWGLQLSNTEVAKLALLLESKGRVTYPYTTLEIIDCQMDLWSFGRLGKALQFSSLLSLVLDYCKLGSEEIERIFSGLENNQRLLHLSLRYCGLGPHSGARLGAVITWSAICELHLDGNYLQCCGALALLRPIAEYAEVQGQVATPSPDNKNSPELPQASQRGSSTVSPVIKSPEAVTGKTTSGKKKKRTGMKEKSKGVSEVGPWLVKLYLTDNGIDGKEGENDLLELTQTLTCLIKYSVHLRELELGNNVLGEMAAIDILQALRARKTGKLPDLRITITPQISSDTFSSIWKNSKKSSIAHKKKKKG